MYYILFGWKSVINSSRIQVYFFSLKVYLISANAEPTIVEGARILTATGSLIEQDCSP